MFRILALFLIILIVISGLILLFLASPLPKALVGNYVAKTLPGGGYFKIRKLETLPWKPIEVSDLEIQLEQDPSAGLGEVKKIRISVSPFDWNKEKLALFEIEDASFASEDFNLNDFDATIPLYFSDDSVSQIQSGSFQIKDLQVEKVYFSQITGETSGFGGDHMIKFAGQGTLGSFEGTFRYQPFEQHAYDLKINLIDVDLVKLAEDLGGFFRAARGRCFGDVQVVGNEFEIQDVIAEMNCPRPGGRFQSAFLKGLVDYIPDGAARQIFKEEVAEKDNYYYDDASLNLKRLDSQYWRVHIVLNSPRLQLDVPIDISEESLETVFENKNLKKILNTIESA